MKTANFASKIEFFSDDVFARSVVILISGKAGTGKSTVGQMLHERLSDNWDVIFTHFAEGVKECARKFFKWDDVKDGKGRRLLQGVGQLGREYNPAIWVEYILDNVIYGNKPQKMFIPDIIIVDDWRFPNEAKGFDPIQFQVIKVKINAPDREILKGTPYYDDVSETSLDNYPKFDFVIDNSGSMEGLEESVNQFINEFFKRGDN